MEAYVYDLSFNRTRILDTFTSLIWNDVYCGYGDFEIEYPMNVNGLAYVNVDNYLGIQESDRYMIIEKIEIETSFTTGNIVRLSGRSLECILERRILRETVLANDTPVEDLISNLLNKNIIAASNPKRNVTGFAIKRTKDARIKNMKITGEYSIGDNLYKTIQKICEERNLGFKITLHDDEFFQFELYAGLDHSYDQQENAWVVFSSKFENLEESDMKLNLTNLRNCMEIDYITLEKVVNPDTEEEEDKKVIIPIVVGDDASGLDRRELYGESNFEADVIDKSMFGTAEARVDQYEYSEWVVISFDSGGYKDAMKKYNDMVSARVSEAAKPRYVTKTYYTDVDTSETPGAEWINTKTETVEEDPEERTKRVASVLSSLSGREPKKSDYERWGWAITDYAGYQKALDEAQKAIDEEFRKAQLAALNYAKARVAQWGAEELSEYRTITSFDGKVDPNVNFLYGRDYGLGDLVQIVNEYQFNAKTRVVSVLFSQDNQNGIIARPTFQSDDVAIVDFGLEDAPETSMLERSIRSDHQRYRDKRQE